MSWTVTASNLLVDEPEAISYLAAVETADGQALESGVRLAVNAFVKGCKADGIWPAIKASCILAGARTLNGALVPLVGTAPTNSGPFVSGDYNRKTGLVGDGSTKYLDSNRANNADPQNSKHIAVYRSTADTLTVARAVIGSKIDGAIGGCQLLNLSDNRRFVYIHSAQATQTGTAFSGTGLWGASRAVSNSYVERTSGSNQTITEASLTPPSESIIVFARRLNTGAVSTHSDARLAFYSIGESLDLALLDSRVTALITAFGTAIA